MEAIPFGRPEGEQFLEKKTVITVGKIAITVGKTAITVQKTITEKKNVFSE